jgi:hypothetical protein
MTWQELIRVRTRDEERVRITDALGDMLRCPCCGSDQGHEAGCTFFLDDPAAAEQLDFLQRTIRGEQ